MIHVTEIDTFTKIKLFSKLKIINNIRFGLSKPLHHHHRSKITRSNSLRPMQFILPASVTLLTTGSHTPLQLTSFADYIHTHTHTRPLHIPRFTFRSLATRRTWSPRWHFPPRSRPCKIESAFPSRTIYLANDTRIPSFSNPFPPIDLASSKFREIASSAINKILYNVEISLK